MFTSWNKKKKKTGEEAETIKYNYVSMGLITSTVAAGGISISPFWIRSNETSLLLSLLCDGSYTKIMKKY